MDLEKTYTQLGSPNIFETEKETTMGFGDDNSNLNYLTAGQNFSSSYGSEIKEEHQDTKEGIITGHYEFVDVSKIKQETDDDGCDCGSLKTENDQYDVLTEDISVDNNAELPVDPIKIEDNQSNLGWDTNQIKREFDEASEFIDITKVKIEEEMTDEYGEIMKQESDASSKMLLKEEKTLASECDADSQTKTVVFICHHCGLKRKSLCLLRKHIMGHFKTKKHVCLKCNKRFATSNTLELHLRTHTGRKPYQCHECDYSGNTIYHLESHMRTHTNEMPFGCDICDFKCKRKDSLKRHKVKHGTSRPFACESCHWEFPTANALRQHRVIHTGEKPYACQLCDFRSTRAGNVAAHVKMVHQKMRPFECDHCDLRFSTRHNLNLHTRIHTGEKPFTCYICGYKAAQSGCIKDHLMTHFKSTRKCQFCDYSSESYTMFKSHIKKTHSNLCQNSR